MISRYSRSLLIAALALTTVGGMAYAQPKDEKPAARPAQVERPGAFLEEILPKLNLTEDQKTRVKEAVETSRKAVEEARASGDRQKVREARQGLMTAVREILTPEQQQTFRDLMAQQRGAATRPGQMMGPAARIQAALASLDLSEDQKAKIKAIVDEYRPKFQEIAQAADEDRRERMQQMQPILKEMREKITALLTPEQAKLLQEKLSEGRDSPGPRDGQRQRGPRDGDRKNANKR